MKRAWMRPAAAAIVVVSGLTAIVLATRGSISTSQAAPPEVGDRPHYVRPTDDPSLQGAPRTREPFRKSALELKQPVPRTLPAQPQATALISDAPASNSRYVTQNDVQERPTPSPYAAPNRYEQVPAEQSGVQRLNFEGSPNGTTVPPATANPTNANPALGGVSIVSDAGAAPALPATLPATTHAPAAPRPFPGAANPGHNPPVTVEPQPYAAPAHTPPQSAPPTLANHENVTTHMQPSTPAQMPNPTASLSTGNGRPGAKHLEGPQSPTLVIEKALPPELQVGRPAKFIVTVRNVGQAVAHDVEIRDEIPAGAQLVASTPRANRGTRGELIWPIGTIKPNDEVTVEMEVMPMTEGEIGSVATVHFATSASGRVMCTRPELVVDVVAPREVLSGDEWPITIKVSNPGTGVAANVTLSEVVPAGFEHPAGPELEYDIGDLQPNEVREVRLSLRAMKPGTLMNRLKVRGEGPLVATKDTPVNIVAPALDVTLDGGKRRFLDRQAVYTLVLSNPGTAPAREVMLAAQLPPGLEFVEANNSGQFDPRTRTVHWQLEELPAQEQGKVTLTTVPTEPGDLPFRITSTAIGGLAVEKQETIRIEGIAALVFQVVDEADPIDVRGETNYEIRVTNQGSKAAENVQIVAQLPPELKAVSAEGPARYEIVGQQVLFQPLARLAAKSETVYVVRVQAQRAGDVKIAVQLKSADLSTPVTKEEATRILSDQ